MKEYSEEDLVRYVTRDMDGAERSQIEEALRQDADLRGRLSALLVARDEAQTWFSSPAPGEDRVKSLVVPKLAVLRADVVARRRKSVFVGRMAIAVLIFAAGFLAGNFRPDPVTQRTPAGQAVRAVSTPAVAGTGAVTPTQGHSAESVPPAKSTGSDEAELRPSDVQPPIVTEEKDGRVIVQTTLRSSGTRATWIVDGEFQLAQSAAAAR